jgi:hypothetical protein
VFLGDFWGIVVAAGRNNIPPKIALFKKKDSVIPEL